MDGDTLDKRQAYEAIDNARSGTRFLRVTISPDPKREDSGRDLNLREITREMMREFQKQFPGRIIQFFAAVHEGHTDKRHVNLLVLFPGGRLTKHHWKALRERTTAKALAERTSIDLSNEAAPEHNSFRYQARLKKRRSVEHSYATSSYSRPKPLCPLCLGPMDWNGQALECPNCHLSFSRGKGSRLTIKTRGLELVSEKGGRAAIGQTPADLLLALRVGLDRLSHSDLMPGAKHPIHKARFAHVHEMQPLMGGASPEFGKNIHIGIGPYNRVLRIGQTQSRKEIGGILVSAPPRSGKTLGVITDLLTWSGSVIVNDNKGELYEKTAGFRSGFSNIRVLDCRGVGHRFDPLDGAQTEEDFRMVAGHLLTGIKVDAFTIRAITMQAAMWQAGKLEGLPAFPYSANLIHCGPEMTAERLDTVSRLYGLTEGQNLSTRFLDRPLEYADFSDRYFQSAWSLLKNMTEPVYTETILKTLGGSDFTIEDLIIGDRPTSLYIRMPESRLDSLTPLMRLYWGSLLDTLLQLYDDRHGRGCNPVLALIDEAGAAPIPALPRFSSTAAGRGIILKVIVQDHNQLEHAYGHANALTVINNMDTQIFFRQNGIATAEYVQKRVGYNSEYAHSETTNEHKSGAESQSEQAVPLLPLDEITQLPDGEAIILHRNFKPIKAARMDFLRFPRLIALTEKTAPDLPAIPAPPPIPEILPDEEDDFPPRYGPRFTDEDRE
jgi:type IV secretory pathway TraG/TraD family ATPase VirD4